MILFVQSTRRKPNEAAPQTLIRVLYRVPSCALHRNWPVIASKGISGPFRMISHSIMAKVESVDDIL